MMRASICLLSLFAALASSAPAQSDIGCAGPTLGYVLQPGVGVRPVVGIPGSARIADPLPVGIEISSIAVSPELNFILDLSALGGRLRALALNDGASSVLVAIDEGLFRLTELSQGPAWVFDGGEPRVVFVPAALEGGPGGAQ